MWDKSTIARELTKACSVKIAAIAEYRKARYAVSEKNFAVLLYSSGGYDSNR